jgi:hypothetical protein
MTTACRCGHPRHYHTGHGYSVVRCTCGQPGECDCTDSAGAGTATCRGVIDYQADGEVLLCPCTGFTDSRIPAHAKPETIGDRRKRLAAVRDQLRREIDP